MSEYKALLEKKRALDAEIEQALGREKTAAVEKARSLVTEFELTERDVFGGRSYGAERTKKVVAPKYRDPATGKTWTGRGKPPRWITGPREQYLIA